jgi:hypothetical protein
LNPRPESSHNVLRSLLRVGAMNFLAALAAILLVGWFEPRMPLRELLQLFEACLVYSFCIGMPIGALTPLIIVRSASRPMAARLLLLSASILTLVTGGCLLATPLLTLTGILPGAWTLFGQVLRIGSVLALALGITAFFFANLTLRESRTRALLAEARLAALQSRVNPHFLFNALNSIASLIPDDPALAERLVGRLAALLRLSLDADRRPSIPLREELHITRDYLEIEAARYAARLRFSFDVPMEAESVPVPLLSVQGLVENAVRHAISPSPEGGEIAVTARLESNWLVVAVADSGSGFDLAAVPAGHGLDNLRRRLDGIFGAGATLDTVREAGRFAVRFRVAR